MKYKIAAFDLDGTLTNKKKEVTERTKRAIQELAKEGVHIVLASGRPTHGIEAVAQAIDLKGKDGYVLSFNGGKIIRYASEEVVYANELSAELGQRIMAFAKEYEIPILTYDDQYVVTEFPEDEHIRYEGMLNHMELKKVENISEYVTYATPKYLMVAPEERLLPVMDKMIPAFPECNLFRSEAFFLEVMPKGIDKKLSLKRLLEYLDCKPEEMIAFGDGFNDIPMLRLAGCGVAMANSCKEVLDIADEVTKSNEEDGVAVYIEKLLNIK